MNRAPTPLKLKTIFVYRIAYCVLRLFPPHPNPHPRRGEGIKNLYLLIHSIRYALYAKVRDTNLDLVGRLEPVLRLMDSIN